MHINVHTLQVHENGKSQKWLSYSKKVLLAGVAQLVEQLPCKQQVIGSSPIASPHHPAPVLPSKNALPVLSERRNERNEPDEHQPMKKKQIHRVFEGEVE